MKERVRKRERERERKGRKRERRRKKGRREIKGQMHWTVQAVLTGMDLWWSWTSAHALNPVTYWEAPASNISACAEILSLSGKHQPPTSAHVLRSHHLLGGNSFQFVHYMAITQQSSYHHGNRLSMNKGSLERAFLWFLLRRRTLIKNYWPCDFPNATVANTLSPQSRGPGLDLVWERDPSCHSWVCMHDEDPIQRNKKIKNI